MYSQFRFWIPALISAFVLVFVPYDVLTKFPILNEFVDLMSKFVPSVQGWQKDSMSPEKTAVMVSVSWLFFPYLFVLHVIEMIKNKDQVAVIDKTDSYIQRQQLRKFAHRHVFERFIILISFYPFIFLVIFLFLNISQPASCYWCMNQSLGVLWLSVNLIVYFTSIMMAAIVLITIQFKKILFMKI